MSESNTESLWQAVSCAAPKMHKLTGTETTDVVVIGAGFCGLSTSLHLAQKGIRVKCLEASSVGFGASGRNNGQVIAGLKLDPTDVIAMLGVEAGEKLITLSSHAPDLVFELIKKFGIDCDANRKGWIQPARSPSAIKSLEARFKQWENYQVGSEMIETSKLSDRLGTSWYKAAWFDPRGGSINPLAFARGLALAAINEGVSINTNTPVLAIQKNTHGWLLKTPLGQVKSKVIVMCTNAYNNGLDKNLTRSVIPVRTAQICSEVLSKEQYASILPGGEMASDTSRLLTSFRLTADKRLIMGGAYATGGNKAQALVDHLKKAALNRFPHLGAINFEYAWSGCLAITPSHLPHVFEIGERSIAGIGCNGRGIAMTISMGKSLAKLALRQLQCESDQSDIPFPITKTKPIAFHRFRSIGIAANVAWNDFLDRINK